MNAQTEATGEPAPITRESLRALFEQHGIVKGPHRLPSLEGFDELDREANRIREWVEDWRRCREHERDCVSLTNLLKLIAEILPDVAERRRAMLSWAEEEDNGLASEVRADVEAVQFLAHGVNRVRSRPFLRRRSSNTFQIEGWHDFAGELANAFRYAMCFTNPGLPLRNGDDGPVARFLAAIIPLITGEAPTPVAVARHLQRASRTGSNNRK